MSGLQKIWIFVENPGAMTIYTNPPGAPPISFAPRTRFTRDELGQICIAGGTLLHVPSGIDGAQLLWALAGKESSFGANSIPRHEVGYCTGKYSAGLTQATAEYGHGAHCSYGPWQLLWANTKRLQSPEKTFADLRLCMLNTVAFLNSEILGRQHAMTLEEVADAYNSGNFRDKNVPQAYIEEVISHYNNVPLPSLTIHAAAGEGGAINLYHAIMDAIEFCGRGSSALEDVPLELALDNRILTVTESDVQWNTNEHGNTINRIRLTCR